MFQSCVKNYFLRLEFLLFIGLGIIYPLLALILISFSRCLSPTAGIGGLFAYLDLFSGGNLRNCTLFALGIMPYITASIMMQMLTMSVPSLEMLVERG